MSLAVTMTMLPAGYQNGAQGHLPGRCCASRLARLSHRQSKYSASAHTAQQQPPQPPKHVHSSQAHPLINVASPAAYTQQWSLNTKSRLDALWSVVIQTGNAERLLLTLDDLLMQLRSCRTLSIHIQQHHTDPAWAAAGRQVAADCIKYERYISSNRAVAKRLHTLLESLQRQQQQQQQGEESKLAVSGASARSQQQVAQGAGGVLSLQQQLKLCSMLLLSLQPSAVEDSMQWLAALELPDSSVQQVQRLQSQERDLVAAIDRLVSQPVTVVLPYALQQLLQRTSTYPPSDHNSTGGKGDSTVKARTQHQQPPAPAAEPQHQQQQQQQRQEHRPVAVSVTKGLLARLLQQCPDAAVHQQLYQDVLQPKLQQASGLLGQLARCRLQQARLSGYDSYYAMTRQRLQGAAAGANQAQAVDQAHPIEFLLQIQESLEPLCQQEVAWIVSQASTQLAQQQQQQQQHPPGQHVGITTVYAAATGGPDAAAGSRAAATADGTQQAAYTGPWDWDFLQYQATLPHTSALQQGAAVLQQHLQLSGVVAGFSCLLHDMLCLRLVPRAAVGAEVWAPHVLVLDVVKQQQQQQQQQGSALLGSVYVDIGGGYGARMLRYARRVAGAGADAVAGSAAALHKLPAVAVGISGCRLAPQQQQMVGSPAISAEEVRRGGCAPVAAGLVLSVSQLWEIAHELGHAVHLVASSRQAACHLSGRFLPPELLELPPQLMERLMCEPDVLAGVCLHCDSQDHLPAHLATALAAYFSSRYNSALSVSARVATSLAELMYGEYGGDMEDYWRGAWEAAAGLPEAVAASGCLREVSLLPVMAAHQGTYHCYLQAWLQASQLHEQVVRPLLRGMQECTDGCHERDVSMETVQELQAAVGRVFDAHVSAETKLPVTLVGSELRTKVWAPAQLPGCQVNCVARAEPLINP